MKNKMTQKVFCVYRDGDHLGCYETELEAHRSISDMYVRYLEIEEENFEPDCDCKNNNLPIGFGE